MWRWIIGLEVWIVLDSLSKICHSLSSTVSRLSSIKKPAMTKNILLLALFLLPACLAAQTLTDFNTDRLARQKKMAYVLGGWAVANMAVGLGLQGSATGETKYFHQMNAGWNVVNLALAGASYWAASRVDPSGVDLAESFRQQHNIQKILLLNAGLDVGYIAAGAWMNERGMRLQSDRLRGFGKSLIVQGAFLLVFDLSSNFLFAAHNRDLLPYLGVSSEGIGLSLQF